jgi:putative ABC transport system substrate-binding protein
MQRRDFITVLGGTAVAWPLAARGQQAATTVIARKTIGVLSTGPSPSATSVSLDAFYQKLRELGYTEGQSAIIEQRYGDTW